MHLEPSGSGRGRGVGHALVQDCTTPHIDAAERGLSSALDPRRVTIHEHTRTEYGPAGEHGTGTPRWTERRAITTLPLTATF